MAHGNSITRGFGSSDVTTKSYPPLLQGLLDAAQPGQWVVTRKGFDGFTTPQLTANFAAEVHALYAASVGRNVVLINEGGNQIKNGATVQEAIDSMLAYCSQARDLGWEVWISTATPRVNTTQVMANIAAFNDYLRAHVLDFGSKLVDFAADPSLDDAHDLTFYNPDGIHPTDAGYAAIANVAFANAL